MRVLKLLTILSLQLIIFSSIAQKEVATIEFPYRSMQDFEFSKNQNGDYCLFVSKKEFYYFCYISKEGEKIYDTTLKETSSVKPQFLGVKADNNRFIYYFIPAYPKKNLRSIIITKDNSQSLVQTDFLFFNKKREKFVHGASTGFNFHVISASVKSASLYVSRITDANSFEKKDYPVTIDEKILSKNSNITPSIIIKKMFSRAYPKAGYEMLNPIQSQFDNNQFFIDNNYLHFSFDEGDAISINQESNKLYYNFFLDDLPGSTKDFSSFIFQNLLYRVIVTSKELFLKIYALENGNLIKEFHYTNDNEFDLFYAPFIKCYNSKKIVDDDDDTMITLKEIFKNLSRGNITIYCFNGRKDEINIFIGSNIATRDFFIPIHIPSSSPSTLILPIATFNSPSGNFVFTETVLSGQDFDIVHPEEIQNDDVYSNVKIWPDTSNQISPKYKVKFSESDTHLYVLQLFNDEKQLVITEFKK